MSKLNLEIIKNEIELQVSILPGEIFRGEKGEQGERGETGERGMNGKSAYEIWLEAGHSGTIEDFLNFIRGEKGEKGENGEDALDFFSVLTPENLNVFYQQAREKNYRLDTSELDKLIKRHFLMYVIKQSGTPFPEYFITPGYNPQLTMLENDNPVETIRYGANYRIKLTGLSVDTAYQINQNPKILVSSSVTEITLAADNQQFNIGENEIRFYLENGAFFTKYRFFIEPIDCDVQNKERFAVINAATASEFMKQLKLLPSTKNEIYAPNLTEMERVKVVNYYAQEIDENINHYGIYECEDGEYIEDERLDVIYDKLDQGIKLSYTLYPTYGITIKPSPSDVGIDDKRAVELLTSYAQSNPEDQLLKRGWQVATLTYSDDLISEGSRDTRDIYLEADSLIPSSEGVLWPYHQKTFEFTGKGGYPIEIG